MGFPVVMCCAEVKLGAGMKVSTPYRIWAGGVFLWFSVRCVLPGVVLPVE